MKILFCRAVAALVFLALFTPLRSLAQAGPASGSQEPRFEIRNYVVDGATLVSADEVQAALRPFTGQNRDFSHVQRALETLEKIYSSRGYSAVQVILPEQEIDKGEVRFKVIEARIGRVLVERNKFFDEANVRASLPSLAPGEAPNINRVAQNLRLANENPARQETVLLRGGNEEGLVDAVVRVVDEPPTRYSITFDNTGTQQTGIYRIGFGYQNANVLNRDHVFSAQYVTAPVSKSNPNSIKLYPSSRVTIVGGSYKIPLYSLGDSLEFTFGYSNVDTGLLQNLFTISGAGSILGLRYNLTMPRWRDLEQRFSLAWDWRAYRNQITQVGTSGSLVPDIAVHPLSGTYTGTYRTAVSDTSFYGSAVVNLPGGDDGGSTAFFITRPGARPGYLVWRWGASHNRAFANDWQMRIAMNGQMTRDPLVSAEQFGLGGIDSIRGFGEREIANDRGHRGSMELYTPDWGSTLELPGGTRARGLVFYDWGWVQRTNPLPGETTQQGAGSVGFGVRLSRGANLSVRLDFGIVVDKGGIQDRGDGRLHASMAYIF
ncbi:MAG: ShlB/FhaC/HecB family hemolysin secretion/activation protein [Betaproteobacteria bacterium]|nr:ShlB/FhaC/HecB family hemolysin secretion/activation protein [Betaproteobacteria bacterium]